MGDRSEGTMFNWAAAATDLYNASKSQIAQFLARPDNRDVYGLGFFCNADDGVVYLVANTEQYYRSSLLEFEKRFGPTDKEVYRWDSGNWKYPGGLFLSSSPEQLEFEKAWESYQKSLSQLELDDKQALLEDVCRKVLRWLSREGVLSKMAGLQGVTILGPDDQEGAVLEKKQNLSDL
jgi:hypothetical protein